MTKIAGIILAGGQARRMGGGDKSLEPLGQTTVLKRVISRISPQVDTLALNANGDPARFADYALPVLADSIQGFVGPLAGILAGMDWAHELGYSQIVSVAADTPFFPLNLVQELSATQTKTNTPIAIAATPDPERGLIRQPVFGLWSVDLRDPLRDALNDGIRKIIVWAEDHGVVLAPFPTPHTIGGSTKIEPFFNINTKEDLATARQITNTLG